jgi:hypothetical protein
LQDAAGTALLGTLLHAARGGAQAERILEALPLAGMAQRGPAWGEALVAALLAGRNLMILRSRQALPVDAAPELSLVASLSGSQGIACMAEGELYLHAFPTARVPDHPDTSTSLSPAVAKAVELLCCLMPRGAAAETLRQPLEKWHEASQVRLPRCPEPRQAVVDLGLSLDHAVGVVQRESHQTPEVTLVCRGRNVFGGGGGVWGVVLAGAAPVNAAMCLRRSLGACWYGSQAPQ